MNDQTGSNPLYDSTVNTDAAGGEAAKKGGCRRVLAWGLLICGLLALIGGGGGAAWANFTAQPSTFWTCQNADRDKAKADASFEELKKRGLENIDLRDRGRLASLSEADKKAMSDYDSQLQISSMYQDSCATDLYYRRRWRNILLVVAAIGLFGALLGYFLRR